MGTQQLNKKVIGIVASNYIQYCIGKYMIQISLEVFKYIALIFFNTLFVIWYITVINRYKIFFLIQTCIHLTLSLIGDMRMSNIELILQHLEYLSEQTMNCYAKLWYYVVNIDVAIELGYQLLPIQSILLDNIGKYRRKLVPGGNERSLLLIYCDCTLAQIYARLGLLDSSKIFFHQALNQIKYEQIHISNIDFRFRRALLKLIEVQLLHWYYKEETNDHDDVSMTDYLFLNVLNEFKNEQYESWNKSRYMIYEAYYDRLVNDYRRTKNNLIDVSLNLEGTKMKIELLFILTVVH